MSDFWTSRVDDDRGVVGGADALLFGVLTLVLGSFLIINVWAVIDTAFATSAASREAARIYVESDNGSDAGANAERRAKEVMAEYGRNRATTVTSQLETADFTRCALVEITVSYDVPLIQVPGFGSIGTLTSITSSHSERVDAYRSGEFTGECNV